MAQHLSAADKAEKRCPLCRTAVGDGGFEAHFYRTHCSQTDRGVDSKNAKQIEAPKVVGIAQHFRVQKAPPARSKKNVVSESSQKAVSVSGGSKPARSSKDGELAEEEEVKRLVVNWAGHFKVDWRPVGSAHRNANVCGVCGFEGLGKYGRQALRMHVVSEHRSTDYQLMISARVKVIEAMEAVEAKARAESERMEAEEEERAAKEEERQEELKRATEVIRKAELSKKEAEQGEIVEKGKAETTTEVKKETDTSEVPIHKTTGTSIKLEKAVGAGNGSLPLLPNKTTSSQNVALGGGDKSAAIPKELTIPQLASKTNTPELRQQLITRAAAKMQRDVTLQKPDRKTTDEEPPSKVVRIQEAARANLDDYDYGIVDGFVGVQGFTADQARTLKDEIKMGRKANNVFVMKFR